MSGAVAAVADDTRARRFDRAANVLPLVGRDERVYEVVDREEDLARLVEAIKKATRARATR